MCGGGSSWQVGLGRYAALACTRVSGTVGSGWRGDWVEVVFGLGGEAGKVRVKRGRPAGMGWVEEWARERKQSVLSQFGPWRDLNFKLIFEIRKC